ncbi:efflux RND transporter periplasmic adaptor subunit [Paenibacillus sp. GCM10027626]|uniref:efflux RND transporter periplasmic adaptor subunit n=1 Tax=Paenibacillus sp. GCM10027626 TaxID=3273411 RepID=UPI003637911A
MMIGFKRHCPHSVWHKRMYAIAIGTALALTATGCSGGNQPEPAAGNVSQQASEASVMKVKTAVVQKTAIGEPYEIVAELAASVKMDIVPKTDGEVTEVLKRRGDRVKAGEAIYRLDTRDVRIQQQKAEMALRSLESARAKAKTELKEGKVELKRSITKMEQQIYDQARELNKLRNGYDEGSVEGREVEKAEQQLAGLQEEAELLREKLAGFDAANSLTASDNEIASAKIGLEELERSLGHYVVTAPVDGIITELEVEKGMPVGRGGKSGQVQRIDPITVKAELSEQALQLVDKKSSLYFYTADKPEQLVAAKVHYLAEIMNTQTRTYTLELAASNPQRELRPGMKVQLRLSDEAEQTALTIPSTAIMREENTAFVFVLNNGAAERRVIKLGRVKDNDQEIVSGLKEGERVIVSGLHRMKDKQKVEADEQ